MARRLFSIRTLLMIGALAGATAGLAAYRKREASRMGVIGKIQTRLPHFGRRKPSLMDTVTDLSVRGSRRIQKGARNLADLASERISEDVLPAAMEGTQIAREKVAEVGERTKETLSRMMSRGMTTADKIRESTLETEGLGVGVSTRLGQGMHTLQESAGSAIDSVGDTLGSALRTLVRFVFIGAGIAAVFVYIYAPDRERQTRLWEGAKEGSKQLGRTFQDLREFVSDMRAEAS